jgi:hypothetical protein
LYHKRYLIFLYIIIYMHVQLWGRYGWFILHRISTICGNDKECIALFIQLIHLLKDNLLCSICRTHFKQFIKRNSPEKNKHRLFQWTVDAHNNVNRMYRNGGRFKKNFTYKAASNLYKECHPVAEQMFYIIFDMGYTSSAQHKRMIKIKQIIKKIKDKKGKKCYQKINSELNKKTKNMVNTFNSKLRASTKRREARHKHNQKTKSKLFKFYQKRNGHAAALRLLKKI